MTSNSTITNLAGQQFDMVTPGNEMKWDTTEPSNGSYNFGPGDGVVSFAKAHGMRVRGHNLVWQNQLPSWVSNLPLNQVQQAMESHITTEASHYKGQVYAWDVVNEPFNGDGSFVSDVFYRAMGSGYIADALRTAHAADPGAQLYLNDYSIEGENAKSNAMYSLVQSLLAQGVPINGVGFESHYIVGQVPSSLLANMQRFAALGVNVAVTELDDRIQLPASTASLNQQATDYATVVRDCLQVSRCVGVSQWGVGDADSWIPGTFPGWGAATMYDQNYQPKPAYSATLSALGGSSSTGGGATGPITSGVNSAKCVDDNGLSSANGTKIQLWDCNGGANQSWTVASNGTVQVYGKCLDITGASTANGALVELWQCNGGANQQWHASNGELVNPASGKCLDDPNSNTANGTQLELWACNGGANQQWHLP